MASFLRQAGAEARLEEFKSGTPTAQDAAEAAGCELAQIVKSLVFDCDGRPILVLIPGDRRADRKKIATVAGCASVRIAGAAEVEDATGFAPGAVAPFPLERIERVFIDQNLLAHRLVWIGAGSPNHLAAIPPPELVRLARAQPIDAAEDAV